MPGPSSSSPAPSAPSPSAVLRTLRLLWAATLTGPILFLLVLILLRPSPVANIPQAWRYLPFAGLALVPLGYFLRMQCYKQHWVGQIVTPPGYFAGNLLLFACCETIAILGLTLALLLNSLWPSILPPAFAMFVQLLNFPNGRPMLPPAPAPGSAPGITSGITPGIDPATPPTPADRPPPSGSLA